MVQFKSFAYISDLIIFMRERNIGKDAVIALFNNHNVMMDGVFRDGFLLIYEVK